MNFRKFIFLGFVLVLFGCDEDQNTSHLGQWTVISLSAPDRNYQSIDSLSLGIEFLNTSNTIIYSVCNGGNASYKIDAQGKVSFISVETTERACVSQELNELEADFIKVLYLVERWSFDNEKLRLSNADGQEINLKRK